MWHEYVSAIATSITALSIGFLAYQTYLLKRQITTAQRQNIDEYDRGRREFTISLMRDWNRSIEAYTAAAVRVAREMSVEQCKDIINLRTMKVNSRQKPLLETCLADVLPEQGLHIEEDNKISTCAKLFLCVPRPGAMRVALILASPTKSYEFNYAQALTLLSSSICR